jgi:hypothetical protein
MSKEEKEYTEVYTFKEKLPIIGKIIIGTLLFVTVYHYYLLPIQKEYFDTLHCRDNFIESVRAFVIIWITILMVLPLYTIYKAKNIIKFKQFPYKDKKYLERIKIKRGKKAVIRGKILIVLSIIVIFSLIGVYVSAEYEVIDKIDIKKIDKSDCPLVKQ